MKTADLISDRGWPIPKDVSVRAQWVQFVRHHRHDYKDPISKYTLLCLAHFNESCYERKMEVIRSVKEEYKLEIRVFLKPTAMPTRDSVTPQSPEKISQRGKRKVRISYVYTLISSDLCYSSSPTYFYFFRDTSYPLTCLQNYLKICTICLVGTGSLWLEEARSRLLCSRPMMMMMMRHE